MHCQLPKPQKSDRLYGAQPEKKGFSKSESINNCELQAHVSEKNKKVQGGAIGATQLSLMTQAAYVLAVDKWEQRFQHN